MLLGVHTSVHGTSTWDWCCRALANPGLSHLGLHKPPDISSGQMGAGVPTAGQMKSLRHLQHSELPWVISVGTHGWDTFLLSPTMFPDGKRTRKSMHHAGLTKGLKSNMHKNYYLLKCLFLGSSGTLCISNKFPGAAVRLRAT